MADFWDSEELVGKIVKNSREEIHIKTVEKNKKKYVDIRVFWYDSNSDTFKPSQKGVTMAYDNYNEFKEIIAGIQI
ncbi:transcriptional coactivator p15 (PC4) [Anaerobacterium chartisolvens]|uniref:Transcriptional coactivator p15 (PC4) n=1 Tax=Anaerobacterium chartisolvens TaxID=1297424 RepID=A0A369BHE7_9FIRM|nr:transcriptional coactivator p15/PC4 family protein [Anaerobacterium chartisolvens]RCX20980.1 transcriptional coactivator p15 (PC4) [Anaerobacterium chartisolvens]